MGEQIVNQKIEDHPAMREELRFLERMVENWQAECNRVDALSNAKQELDLAKLDLLEFKMEAVKKGYAI